METSRLTLRATDSVSAPVGTTARTTDVSGSRPLPVLTRVGTAISPFVVRGVAARQAAAVEPDRVTIS